MNLWTPVEIGLTQGAVLGWAVLGFSVAYRLLGFTDLTVEGSLPIGAATYAVLVRQGLPIGECLVIALMAGWVTGALTGAIHAYFRVNQFLAGIIVVAISYSASLRIMSGPNVSLIAQQTLLAQLGIGDSNARQTITLLILLAFGATGLAILFKGRFGVALRAVGANHRLAEELGIRSQLLIVIGVGLCNLLSAFSGVLLAESQGFSDVSSGQGVLIIALAALTIGEKLTPARRLQYPVFVVFAAVLGSLVYQIAAAVALRIGLAATDLRLATGLLVLCVVALRIRSGADAILRAPL